MEMEAERTMNKNEGVDEAQKNIMIFPPVAW